MVMTVRFVRGWLVLSVVSLGLSSACSLAESREKPSGLYDGGSDWSVIVDKSKRTCGVTLRYGPQGLILYSNPPGGRMPYYFAFARENWTPSRKEYEYEIGNETKIALSVRTQTFETNGTGFAVITGVSENFLNYLVHSKMLYAKAKGIPPERYDLSGFGVAFERFSDCLKDVRDGKSSSPPKVRRMN